MLDTITMYQGERKFVDFSISYSDDWSDPVNQGQAMQPDDVDTAYFYIKKTDQDSTALITLTTDDATQIEWFGSLLRVHLGANTLTLVGDYVFECRVKMVTSGDFVTVDKGKLTVYESVVGNPA